MTRIIAIDPGYGRHGDGCAIAVLREGILVRVAFERYTPALATVRLGVGPIQLVVWERPQIDSRSRAIDPRNLLMLTEVGVGMAHQIAAVHSCPVHGMTPTEWKGSQQKPKHHHYLWESLSVEERAVLGGESTARQIEAACAKGAACRWRRGVEWYPRSWTAHNLLDACALGKRAYAMQIGGGRG